MLIFKYYRMYFCPLVLSCVKHAFGLFFHLLASSLVASDIILRATFIIFHFTLRPKSFLKCRQLKTVWCACLLKPLKPQLSVCFHSAEGRSSCDLLSWLFKMSMLSLVINISWLEKKSPMHHICLCLLQFSSVFFLSESKRNFLSILPTSTWFNWVKKTTEQAN